MQRDDNHGRNWFTHIEHVQKRPGMYIGDTGRLGFARLIGMGVDTLAPLCCGIRDGKSTFTWHAFLNVERDGKDVTISIDHHAEEAPDILERCAGLIAKKDDFTGVDLVVLRGLSDAISITLEGQNINHEVLNEGARNASLQKPEIRKGQVVSLNMVVSNVVDSSKMTDDFLTGFIAGSNRWPGLVYQIANHN